MRYLVKKALLFGSIYFLLVNGVLSQSKDGEGSDGADAIYEQGLDLMRRGQYREARTLLEKALHADPSDPKLHELLGDAYEQLRDSYHAIDAYTESLKREPQRFSAYDKRAHIYYLRRDWTLAIADYSKAIQMRPDIVRNYYNRALAYRELSQFAKARTDFESAYEKGDVNPTAYYLAKLLAMCPDAAIRDGQRAIEYAHEACKQTNYKEYQSLSTLAAAYAEAGQWDEAIRRSKQALEVAVGQDRSTERCICELYEFHEPRREFSFELVANKIPSKAGEALMIANVKYSYGNRMAGIADVRKAIELNPRLSYAHSLFGLFIMMENPREAIQHFNRALEANSKNAEAFSWRGVAYLYLGEYREAQKDSDAALVLDKKLHSASWVNLFALASCGEVDRALSELNRWSRECSNEGIWLISSVRGHCYLIQGRFDDAITELTEALRRDPSDSFAYSDRAVALTSLGKEKEAMQDLEKCSQLAPSLRALTEGRMRRRKGVGTRR
jgi:tetratricopeptide (TPR) repeat protein